MSNVYYSNSDTTIQLDRKIGQGGEGLIYLIHGYPSDVAKIYIKQQPPEVHRKILSMVNNPPADPTVNGPTKHRSIAWPKEVLYFDRQKTRFAGLTMPKVDTKAFKPILTCLVKELRKQEFAGNFTWLHLYYTARNLASCIAALHERGYLIGDINESNILVHKNTILSIIDCDSFQFKDARSGELFRCKVGKGEYTAPELLGVTYANVDRTEASDCFALAVLIFRLLMEGIGPHQAIGPLVSNLATPEDKIKAGIFAYATSKSGIAPMPDSPPFEMFPPEIRALFIRCFDTGHKDPSMRPSAKEWFLVVKNLTQNLMQCSKNENHHYFNHLHRCPWCERATKLGKDFFPSPVGQQVPIIDPNNPSLSKQEIEKYLLSLIEMALMDGNVSPEEEAFLIDQGLKLHITERDTKKLIETELQRRGLLPISKLNPVPKININKSYIEFKDVQNGTSVSETIEIGNIGDGVMTGSISASVPWVKVPSSITPNMKNQFQKIDIKVDTTGLPYGFSGTGNVSINTNGGNKNITINLKTEGLQLLLPQFRSRYVPLVAALCGFMGSFNKSPIEGFLTGAIGYGLLTYLLSKFILKFTLKRGIELCNFPRGVIHGISSALIFLTIFSHSNTQSVTKGYAPVPAPASAPVKAPAPVPEVPTIRIKRAVIAENIDSNHNPIGINTTFYANASYDNNSRTYVVFYIEYEGAIVNKTEFSIKWLKDGQEAGLRDPCRKTLPASSGSYWCQSGGYYLQAGNYEAILIADGQEIKRTSFSVLPSSKVSKNEYTPLALPPTEQEPSRYDQRPAKVKQITGEIVRKDDRTITIQSVRTGSSVTIFCTYNELAELKNGDRVTIKYAELDGRNTAKRINIKRPIETRRTEMAPQQQETFRPAQMHDETISKRRSFEPPSSTLRSD